MKILILAGGSGRRLWPLSTEEIPKQFLYFGGEFSFLQKTVKRFLSLIPPKDLWVIGHEKYRSLMEEQLKALDPLLESQIILEPDSKNTAPATVLALKFLEDKKISQNEIVVIVPSDHLINDELLFLEKVIIARDLAHQGKLVLLGVPPHKPEAGFGYIKVNPSTYEVESFVEKPSEEKAEEFLREGTYLWNSGIFVFKIATFWEEIKKHHPILGEITEHSYSEIFQLFSELPSISIDYALMEKTTNACALTLDLFWSDMGSWDSIFESYEKDIHSNVKIGNILDVDTKNSLIIGGKKMILALGLEDMVVIETEEALFIGKRSESQKIKTVMEELKKR